MNRLTVGTLTPVRDTCPVRVGFPYCGMEKVPPPPSYTSHGTSGGVCGEDSCGNESRRKEWTKPVGDR